MSHDWQHITESHGPLVWTAVYRILKSHSESLDCYQDVMLEAFQKSRTKQINNWPGYLRWIAVRRAIDRLRQQRRDTQRIDGSQDVALVSTDNGSTSSIAMGELKERLRCELATLPDRQAEVFWLRFIEQMSYTEIAEQMNIDANLVGVLVHRARTRIRNSLSDLAPSKR